MALIEACAAMALLYALLSIVASAAKEAIETWAQKRKDDFRGAMRDLLQEEGAKRFLEHARIRALTSTTGPADPNNKNHWPSYVDPTVFAVVAADLAREFPNSRIGEVVTWAATTKDRALDVLQQVYSERMERLSGSFKRHAQKSLLVIGLGVAVLVDADTIQMARRLSSDAPARTALAQLSMEASTQQDLEKACGVMAGDDPQAKSSKLIACVQTRAPDLLGWNGKKVAEIAATPWPMLPFVLLGAPNGSIHGDQMFLPESWWSRLDGRSKGCKAGPPRCKSVFIHAHGFTRKALRL